MQLVLASTSAYRRQLLERFGIRSSSQVRISTKQRFPAKRQRELQNDLHSRKPVPSRIASDALIIGGDQVAHIGERRFGKPGSIERAISQLTAMRGKPSPFHTACAC